MSGALPIRAQRTGVPEEDRRAHDARADVAPLARLPFARGVLLEGIDFVGGTVKKIPHKLGRRPVGWFPTWSTGGPLVAVVIDDETDATTLALQPAATCTGSLWVW